MDLSKLSKELSKFIDYYDKDKEKFEALIDRNASILSHILNPNMEFKLRYIDGSKFHNKNFKCIDGEFKSQKVQFLTAFDGSPDTHLSNYFNQRLETQVVMARNLVGALKNLDKVKRFIVT